MVDVMESVKDYMIVKSVSADKLIRQMRSSGGFTAKNLAIGVDILEKMLKDKESLNFLSFTS
ncbi:MAG: hypothetical protein QXH37_00510 [Candidatus Bathyarchaeia archaeon]